MARFIYTGPAQSRHRGVLRPVLQLPIVFEAPSRTTLERLPPALQALLSSYPDQCNVEVVTVRDPFNDEYDRHRFGFIKVTLGDGGWPRGVTKPIYS